MCSSGTGGLQALLAGILRGDGTWKGYLDSSFLPWATPAPFLRAGSTGQLFAAYGSATPFAVPCLVTAVTSAGQVAGVMNWTVEASLNILAGTRVYLRAT